ncbi:hypothetical protein C8R45DRAFT_887516, partial [Mycena sanguinolenta]
MRERYAKETIQKLRRDLKTKSRWSGTRNRTYTSQYRSLALAFTRAGCAQAKLGSLLVRVGKILGIKVTRGMSRRTVGRVVTEAGIKVRLQLGYELARAKNICLSSDGTSVRNLQVESRHITYTAPTYTSDPNAPQTAVRTRAIGATNALDHTAQTQFEGWEDINRQIYETYMNSPLSKRDSLQGIKFDLNDTWRKMVAYNADHAKDAKKVARLCGDKKAAVVETDFGEAELELMTSAEAEEALWEVVQEISVDPEGLDPKALPNDLRTEALQSLARHLGSRTIESLSESQQTLLTTIIFAGCCEHKDHNCTKEGVVGMNGGWEVNGLTPPILLANKDNAATI